MLMYGKHSMLLRLHWQSHNDGGCLGWLPGQWKQMEGRTEGVCLYCWWFSVKWPGFFWPDKSRSCNGLRSYSKSLLFYHSNCWFQLSSKGNPAGWRGDKGKCPVIWYKSITVEESGQKMSIPVIVLSHWTYSICCECVRDGSVAKWTQQGRLS